MKAPLTDHPARRRASLRHGLYAPRLARGLAFADRMAAKFKRALEDVVQEREGGIDLHRAALIHSATEAQRVASVNRQERRQAADEGKLSPELGLAFDAAYLKALDHRDRKLAALGLDKHSRSALDAFYARQRAKSQARAEGATIEGEVRDV